ncbi:putative O-methyltransferase YrrM [Williamsia limnetica]|uniref:Putative O-methyltransferase YrrM n=1 Tax=Williamsia limnetica TaxID=882452 RepID=A0A318RBN5_WILLI|nr:O-methyltransferase [Williamsia limnetica]PYE12584.1 putative O-methyltransferase YrrM [Williamsia limnetica]
MSDHSVPANSEATGSAVIDPAAQSRYAEAAIVEDEALRLARERSDELGAPAITPAVGATLSFLARLVNAKAVVEVGTGAGISGLWLLNGMRPEGVLTTIDSEAEHHRAAKLAFSTAGIGPSRTRLINGRAAEVLPRLSDAGYDLVFIDGAVTDQPRFVAEGLRLLRHGGVLVVHNASADGTVADPASSEPAALAAREAALLIADDDSLLPVVIPLGRGLLAAAKAQVEPEPT